VCDNKCFFNKEAASLPISSRASTMRLTSSLVSGNVMGESLGGG